MKKQFAQKVKLIYIDPPYNTEGDDFKYNDRFNHSTWLTFMKNRLEVAKSLLRDDGVIVISIDDNEMAYLKVLCDEIFDRENFIATTPRKTRSGKADVPYGLSQNFDWLLIYTKNADQNQKLFKRKINRKYYKTPDYKDEWRLNPLTTHRTTVERPNSDFTIVNPKTGEEFPVNPNAVWRITIDTCPEYLKAGKIVFPGDYPDLFPNMKTPMFRIFKCEDIRKKGDDFDKATVNNDFFIEFIKDKYLNAKGTKRLGKLFDDKVFSFPKPVALIQKIIEYTTSKDDIILDFFAGSGTTGEAVLQCNAQDSGQRQFILVEQLSEHINICQQRLNKVMEEDSGDTLFVHFELKKYNQAFIEQIKQAKTQADILNIWEAMKIKSFLNYNINLKEQEVRIQDFNNKSLTQQKQELLMCLDKNQLYVNLSSLHDKDFACNHEERKLTTDFYII